MPDCAALEAFWHDRPVEGVLPGCLPWVPYPLGDFGVLLGAALDAAAVGTFLDVGCGVGTKCLAAAERGLAAAGLEIVPAYIAEARRLGVAVAGADARIWDGYGLPWGIVYVNHPLAGDGEQAALERRIQGQMRRGSVLITVNSVAVPPWPVLREVAPADLVAVKP